LADLTEDEARSLVARLNGGQEVTMHPFEFGWVAKRVLTAEEQASGQGVGLGSMVVDRSGVVTVQRSLPVTLVAESYSAERRKGRITGYQIWPTKDEPVS
jgi:hypothetical protein